jgi:NTP pyrophosphatase (non-canonical NTP hydrolase)
MTLDHLQTEIRKLTVGIEHPRVGAALALAEECGEVMRCVLDKEYYGKDVREALAGEVGDVLVALTEVCDRYDLSLERCAENAVAKIREKAPKWREELAGRLTELRRKMDS